VLQLTDEALARLARAIKEVTPRKRRRWLEDIAARLDPTPAQIKSRARQRRSPAYAELT